MTSFYGEYRKDIISDEEENRISRANVDKWIFRLLLILIGFMPLIVLAHTEEVISPLISDVSQLTSGTKGDLFTYYKSLIVLVITIIAGLLLLAKVFFMNGKIRKTIINYFLGIFSIAIVISTIFSPNITIAINGQYNRSDGAISWLCYIALLFIAMNINYPKKVVNYVMYALIPFVFINLFIITMNFIGNDLMQRTWMQKLVTIFLPDGANLAEGSQLVGTLNQWNYMSGMFAILTAMYLAYAVFEKKWLISIVYTIIATAASAVLFMSVSTSGFLTLLIMIPLLIVVVFKSQNFKKGLLILILFVIMSSNVLHILSKENPKVWTESIGFFTQINPYIENTVTKSTDSFKNFVVLNEVSAVEKTLELPNIPGIGLSAGTGRLYIWEKTSNLIEERPMLGYGLDSLMYNFPHYNIDARSGIETETIIVDKPHNTYIGILYGTGLLGLVAIICLLTIILITAFKNIIRSIDVKILILIVPILAYFTQAMFNDSLPAISTVIFILIGIMYALIFMNKEETNN